MSLRHVLALRRGSRRSAGDAADAPWPSSELAIRYHDREWGVPLKDDRKLFEFLVLDAMQAGLSWEIILRKREGFRAAFDNFDPEKVARYDARKVGRIAGRSGDRPQSPENRVGHQQRARVSGGAEGVWELRAIRVAVRGREAACEPARSRHRIPARTAESDAMSRALKKRGFRFVGSTICYAFMQAAGMVNDHTVDCFRHAELARRR